MQAMPDGPGKALTRWAERRKAQVRAIVEPPFHVIERLFGYRPCVRRLLGESAGIACESR
jgi:hypothetical protein